MIQIAIAGLALCALASGCGARSELIEEAARLSSSSSFGNGSAGGVGGAFASSSASVGGGFAESSSFASTGTGGVAVSTSSSSSGTGGGGGSVMERSIAVSAGSHYACAASSDGSVSCWGDNYYGQLGNPVMPVSDVPVVVAGLPSNVTEIAAGGSHACALTAAGDVYCWGWNLFGQLGDGVPIHSTCHSYDCSLTPVAVSGLSRGVAAISAGFEHTCALTTAGAVYCWGTNIDGQLGNDSFANSYAPHAVTGLSSGVVAIAAGSSHTCALTAAGSVLCWGLNEAGELGDGITMHSAACGFDDCSMVPVTVVGLPSDVVAIAAGMGHTCARTAGGAAFCWGYNLDGDLGDGTSTNRNVPVAVTGLDSGTAAIAAGNEVTCAVTTSGALRCWGYGAYGTLGNGSTNNSDVPVDVATPPFGVASVTVGGAHACALTASGKIFCWGSNAHGELGTGSAMHATCSGADCSTVPVEVVGL